ncbi:MAG: hypothetical protein ABFD69_00435 [Candidatus Sumerlaeia bacterium]
MFQPGKHVFMAVVALWAATGCEPQMGSVAGTTDQAELSRIAVEASGWEVRKAAAEKLADQAVLARIALDDESPAVRAAAIDAMTGQPYLAYVALRATHESDRAAADRKITDQVVLSNYIQQVEDPKLIDAVLNDRLTSQALIAWIAINAPGANVREAASRKVTDYDIYEAAAAASPSKWIRTTAFAPTMAQGNN